MALAPPLQLVAAGIAPGVDEHPTAAKKNKPIRKTRTTRTTRKKP